MFSVSLRSNDLLIDESVKTGNNITKFIKEKLNKDSLVIKDSNAINIVSGITTNSKNDLIAEVNFSCEFSISQEELSDKNKLDEFIFYIKNCLENISAIEDKKYLPLHYRKD